MLSGGAYTLNQIIDKNDLQITKGTVKSYTYHGDSGSLNPNLSLQTENRRIWSSVIYRSSSKDTDDLLTGKPVHCYYCPNCTTHVYHHQTVLGDKIIARTGLLDITGSNGFKPAAEIWGKARYKWVPEVAQTFEVLPPNM